MTDLPTEWGALLGMVFLLGLKHGLDPDHIVVIDGIARHHARARPTLARLSGVLFSLGHGVVVTLVAVGVATLTSEWHPPSWLGQSGAAISIFFLLLLGFANLYAVFKAPPGQVVRPVGVKSHFFGHLGGLSHINHPVAIASIGAAFALSFDTISHAIMFSLAGSSVAGWMFSAALGLAFTIGMIVTDALNGIWVSYMITRTDAAAAIASRVMSLGIAALSVFIATVGIAAYLSNTLPVPLAVTPTVLGLVIIALVFALFLAALRLGTRTAAADAAL